MLTIDDLRVSYGRVPALHGISLEVKEGEIVGLVGPNGAGKTTLVNALSGFQRLNGGSVHLEETEVTGWSANRLARAGLVRTFQNVRLFSGLTVFENVEAGAVGIGMRRAEARQRTNELLERFRLSGRAGHAASDLPHGEERRLGIVRALASRPKFLLLDEPAAGLNEAESDELVRTLALARDDFDDFAFVNQRALGNIAPRERASRRDALRYFVNRRINVRGHQRVALAQHDLEFSFAPAAMK